MLNKQDITELVESKIVGTELFIIEVKVSVRNVITVVVDSIKGVSIDDCVQLSRHIEHSIDREKEDFELNVCSPGLDQPLKDIRQYQKYINHDVEIVLKSGDKLKATLLSVVANGIEIEYTKKVKVEGSKRKEIINERKQYNFDDIKTTKLVITF